MKKRKMRVAPADALTLMTKLAGPALQMHQDLTADGFVLTRMVTPRQRKDGSYSVRFVWRRRDPITRPGAGVINTSFSVSWTEIFRLVPTR